jgi:hypothetical protein
MKTIKEIINTIYTNLASVMPYAIDNIPTLSRVEGVCSA